VTEAQSSFVGQALNSLLKRASPKLRSWLIDQQQRRVERLHANMRASLLRSDLTQSRLLALSGHSE
jgi:hypothetical protein